MTEVVVCCPHCGLAGPVSQVAGHVLRCPLVLQAVGAADLDELADASITFDVGSRSMAELFYSCTTCGESLTETTAGLRCLACKASL